MQKIEFFFDYICPFCYRSFYDLKDLKEHQTDLDVSFHPCEIHQRPERNGKHSDLCIQGMFLANDLKVNLWDYSQRIFEAHFTEHRDIEDLSQVADIVKDLVDPAVFIKSIESGKYQPYLQKANRYAFEEVGLKVVPHYKSGSQELPSIEGVGVSAESLIQFLNKIH